MEEALMVLTYLWGGAQFLVFLYLCNEGPYPTMVLYETKFHNLTGGESTLKLYNMDSLPPNTPIAKIRDLDTIEFTDLDSRFAFGLASLLSLCFVFVTRSLTQDREENICDSDFTPETAHNALPWDILFWFIFLVTHYIIFTLVCSPAYIYLPPFVTLLSLVSVYMACLPRNPEMKFSFQSGIFFMLFMASLLVLLSASQNLHGKHVGTSVMICIGLDFLLIYGHTWDSSMHMHTVINCRLFYIACFMALNIFVFCKWPHVTHD
jgi:hypothetical protein